MGKEEEGVTQMTTLLNVDIADCIDEQSLPMEIVAREGSELAEQLRTNGWVARAGWRTTGEDGQPVWHLRFERLDATHPTTR